MGSEDFWPESSSPHRKNATGEDIEQALRAAEGAKRQARRVISRRLA